MKKVLRLGMLVGLLLLVGCQENKESTESKAETKTDEVTIYLMRHGKTMLNTSDRSQGWIDAPLTPAGVEVAEFVGKGIGDSIKFDKVYSSDSGRAIETAEIVLDSANQKKEVQKDKRLREFNFGTYEGMMNEEMWDEVAKSNGMTMEQFMENMNKSGFSKGIADFADSLAELDKEKVEPGVNWPAENYETITKRLKEGLNDIVKSAEENGDNDILIVSHGMSIATLLVTLDPEIESELPPTGLSNASISKIVYKDGQYKVVSVNDMSYAEKGGMNKK